MDNLAYFKQLLLLTGFVLLSGIWLCYRRSRDTFHPAIFLGVPLISVYVWLPWQLASEAPEELLSFLNVQQLEYVQTIYLVGSACLMAGAYFGSGNLRWQGHYFALMSLSPLVRNKIRQGALIIGILSLFTYLSTYWGSSDLFEYGYFRDTLVYAVPATVWLFFSRYQQKFTIYDWFLGVFIASPLLLQGLLKARRGPMLMGLIGISMSWFLTRNRRPRLLLVVLGGLFLGLLALFLVTNRSIITSANPDLNSLTTEGEYLDASRSNEYIFSSGFLLHHDIQKICFWGGRYITIMFIRPIPRQLWPTKYEDAARMFNTYVLDDKSYNLSFESTLGWKGSVGAAEGFFADMWVEFSVFSFVVEFLLGYAFGLAWKFMVLRSGFWIPHYIFLSCTSMYLTTQRFGEMIYRYMLMLGLSWLIWKYANSGKAKLEQNKYYLEKI